MTLRINSATTIKSSTTVGFQPGSLFAAGEQGVWYDPSDFSTMFQDAAGTTGVTAVEQPVGLLLDKRSPNVSTAFNGTTQYLSATLPSAIGTSDYTIECWMYVTSASSNAVIYDGNSVDLAGDGAMFIWSSGTIRFRFIGNGNPVVSASGFSLNTWYHLAIVKSGTGSNNVSCYINGVLAGQMTYTTSLTSTKQTIGTYADRNAVFFPGVVSNFRIVKGTAVYTSNFTPPTGPLQAISGTSLLTCGNSGFANPTITNNGGATFSTLSPFGASTGNHATQSTGGNRPVLSARVNLLTKTEQLNVTPWLLSNCGVSANAATDPIGGSTADLIYPSSTGSGRELYYLYTYTSGVSYTLSIYAKYAGKQWIAFGTNNPNSAGSGVYFDILNGTVGTQPTGYTGTITSVGNGWYRLKVQFTSGTGVVDPFVDVAFVDANGGTGVTASGTDGAYLWGADLRVSNDGVGLPVYQRVNTSTDYDTTGFPFYLAFNGTTDNRFMVTGSISFTSTDKVTSWSGVRKNENSNGMVVELSAAAGTGNPGSFALIAPSLSGDDFYWRSAGTAQSNANYVVASPTTQVACGIGDISGDISTLRLNGTQVATSSTDQGTGNYGNYPIYIGSRGGTSVYLTGRIYSIIVRGAASTSTQISNTESWVNTKTKAY